MSKLLAKGGVIGALILVTVLLGVGVIANSVLPLSSYPITAEVTVKNADTKGLIPNAAVSSYSITHLYFPFGGWEIYYNRQLIGTAVTNSNGVASIAVLSEANMELEVTASGYVTKVDEYQWFSAPAQATVYLTPSGSTPTTVKIRVYAMTTERQVVRDVKISGGSAVATTGMDGYAEVLCPAGSVSLSFVDTYAMVKRTQYWESLDFAPFTASVQAIEGAVYTAIVDEGVVEAGKADYGFDIGRWLFEESFSGIPNWVLVAAAMFLLFRGR